MSTDSVIPRAPDPTPRATHQTRGLSASEPVRYAQEVGRDLDPVMGDPAVVAQMPKHRAKGSLVAARPRWLREHYGEHAVARLVPYLSASARRLLLEPPLPFAWYPLEHLVEIDAAIIRGPMEGDVQRMRDFGDEIARYDLSTLYRVMFRLGTPSFIIRRIANVYGQYLSGGQARTEHAGSYEATVVVEGARLPIYLCQHGISGWLRAAVDMSGGQAVEVEHAGCSHWGEECRWVIRWK